MPAEPPNVLMAPPMPPRLPSRFNPLPADDATDSGEAPAALGIGDDAAILRGRAGEDLVFSTDTLVEDVHFRIAREGPVPGLGIGMAAGEAAHIGMFDDGKQCLVCTEFPHELYGCINVDQVVVRNFFAVQLGKQFRQVTDERCLLVWVFAVA